MLFDGISLYVHGYVPIFLYVRSVYWSMTNILTFSKTEEKNTDKKINKLALIFLKLYVYE